MKRKLYGALAAIGLCGGLSIGLLGGLLAGSLVVAAPALAHHSPSAEFYMDKTVEVKGVITKVDWINPHVFVYMDVTDASGKVTHWSLQSLPTRFFHQSGLTKETLMGDGKQVVTATVNPAKDGTNYGWMMKLTFADGRYFTLMPETPATPTK